jgi:hypothetical protein
VDEFAGCGLQRPLTNERTSLEASFMPSRALEFQTSVAHALENEWTRRGVAEAITPRPFVRQISRGIFPCDPVTKKVCYVFLVFFLDPFATFAGFAASGAAAGAGAANGAGAAIGGTFFTFHSKIGSAAWAFASVNVKQTARLAASTRALLYMCVPQQSFYTGFSGTRDDARETIV